MSKLAKELYDISQDAFKYGSPWTVEQFTDELNNPLVKCLTMTDGGVVIAFILWQVVLDEAELLLVAVSPSFNKKQKGRTLIKQSFEVLRELKVKTLFLEVRQSNHKAIHVYQSLDFEIVGKRKNYYHYPVEDAVLMSLGL